MSVIKICLLSFFVISSILLFLLLIKLILEKFFLNRLIKSDPNFAKLHEYAVKKLGIKIKFDLLISNAQFWLFGLTLFGPFKPIIRLGRNQRKNEQGITTIVLAHEIGHFLIVFQDKSSIDCPTKQSVCMLLREFKAWENAFNLLKYLNFQFNEEEFFKIAAYYSFTHLISKTSYILKSPNNCPRFEDILFRTIMTKILDNLNENLARFLKKYAYIPPQPIFK